MSIGVGVARLKRDGEADVLLSECVRGSSSNGFIISDPGVGDGSNTVLIREGVRCGECLLFNEFTVDGDGPCGFVINILNGE